TAGILQRFDDNNFDYPTARMISRFQVVETTLIRSHCWPEKGCIRIGFHAVAPRGVHQWLK
ncbi:MAG TPA: hypothetical protein VE110_00380, partial [Gemmatimonadaceae bacterium]|nr:hypothetical protein [Gemmatimonadaceae bacterium]